MDNFEGKSCIVRRGNQNSMAKLQNSDAEGLVILEMNVTHSILRLSQDRRKTFET